MFEGEDQSKESPVAALVLRVDADNKAKISVVAFDLDTEESIYLYDIPYGENKPGCWWWPDLAAELIAIEAP